MKQSYRDITSRLEQSPKWYDENGTPRYDKFVPGDQADIYACEVALCEIQCQSCKRKFRVVMSSNGHGKTNPIHERVEQHTLHYGDPPNAHCCPAGPTMNSEMLGVLEFWRRSGPDWIRVKRFEGIF